MPAKKNKIDVDSLTGASLIKEVNRQIRLARSHWDAHCNKACRRERDRAIALYGRLSQQEREKVPQELRIWLHYRSEKYFGEDPSEPYGSHVLLRVLPREGAELSLTENSANQNLDLRLFIAGYWTRTARRYFKHLNAEQAGRAKRSLGVSFQLAMRPSS